jgi:hypothetical protein
MQAISIADAKSSTLDSLASCSGPHSSRGESDRLNDELRRVGHGELRGVHIDVNEHGIVLQGKVSSYYLKQLAQEAIRPLSRSLRIRNQIHVGRKNGGSKQQGPPVQQTRQRSTSSDAD